MKPVIFVVALCAIECSSFSTLAQRRARPSLLTISEKGEPSWDDDVDYEKIWNENNARLELHASGQNSVKTSCKTKICKERKANRWLRDKAER